MGAPGGGGDWNGVVDIDGVGRGRVLVDRVVSYSIDPLIRQMERTYFHPRVSAFSTSPRLPPPSLPTS